LNQPVTDQLTAPGYPPRHWHSAQSKGSLKNLASGNPAVMLLTLLTAPIAQLDRAADYGIQTLRFKDPTLPCSEKYKTIVIIGKEWFFSISSSVQLGSRKPPNTGTKSGTHSFLVTFGRPEFLLGNLNFLHPGAC
jgi:hypothetical protein